MGDEDRREAGARLQNDWEDMRLLHAVRDRRFIEDQHAGDEVDSAGVIYARYSSELQREASIADQLEVCRRFAEAQGWSIVKIYSDAAISGESRFRPGFL